MRMHEALMGIITVIILMIVIQSLSSSFYTPTTYAFQGVYNNSSESLSLIKMVDSGKALSYTNYDNGSVAIDGNISLSTAQLNGLTASNVSTVISQKGNNISGIMDPVCVSMSVLFVVGFTFNMFMRDSESVNHGTRKKIKAKSRNANMDRVDD